MDSVLNDVLPHDRLLLAMGNQWEPPQLLFQRNEERPEGTPHRKRYGTGHLNSEVKTIQNLTMFGNKTMAVLES